MMKEVYENNKKAIQIIPEIVSNLRQQHFYHSSVQLMELTKLLGIVIEGKEELILIAENMLKAQEDNNYILLADILEYDLQPALLEAQLKNSEDDILSKNIANKLKNSSFYCMKAVDGEIVLYCMKDNRQIMLCSSVNPTWEAKTLVESFASNKYDRYIVFGLGAGYHVKQLLKQDPTCKVQVLEMHEELIDVAIELNSLSDFGERLEIKLVHEASDFRGVLGDTTETDYLFIHYPSLQLVENGKIKELLENYFVQVSGMEEQKDNLKRNFKYLSKKNYPEASALINQLEGKDVMLIAGGPSLDKDIEKIKSDRDKYKIVAVGRIMKKLMDYGIVPDMTVIIDSGIATMPQLEGWNHKQIPLILLSTAYFDLSNKYEGDIYLAYQQDYPDAEEYYSNNKERNSGMRLYETGGSVTTFAFDMIIKAKAKTITLVGVDLAFTNGMSHASNANGRAITDTTGLRKVRGNTRNYVYTSKNLDIYRLWIEKRLERDDAPVVKNTSDGAYIKGAISTSL